MTVETISLVLKADKRDELMDRLKLLSQLNDFSKLIFNGKRCLFYAQIGDNPNDIMGFRSYAFDTKDFFEELPETSFIFVCKNTSKLSACMKFFDDGPIEFQFDMRKGSNTAHIVRFKGGKLEMPQTAGESRFIADITEEQIIEETSQDGLEIEFTAEQMKKIKQMIRFSNQETDTLTIKIKSGKVYFAAGWNLEVGDTSLKDCEYYMKAKYFNQFDKDNDTKIVFMDNIAYAQTGEGAHYMFPLDIV